MSACTLSFYELENKNASEIGDVKCGIHTNYSLIFNDILHMQNDTFGINILMRAPTLGV